MSTLTEDPDVVSNAVARLTDYRRNKPVIRALATVLARRAAAVEAVALDFYTARWLDNAEGELLNAAGEVVGEPRLGRADDLYRLWIKARIRINRSEGKIADSYHLVRLIAGQDVIVRYVEQAPAGYRVHVDGTAVDAHELFKLLSAVKPAGVRMNLFYAPELDVTNVFTLSATSSIDAGDSDKGFGDTGNPAVGGKLRGVL